jgi:proton-coupled amino acid transporter
MALAVLFTFGLQFYVPMDILWRKVQDRIPVKQHNLSQILIRTGIMLWCGVVAVVVPVLEPFISLVGAVFFSSLGILVPSVVEAIFLYPNRYGLFKWKLIKDVLLSIFSILALVTGAFVSIQQIIEAYSPEK